MKKFVKKPVLASAYGSAHKVQWILDYLMDEEGISEHEIFDYFISKLQSDESLEILKEFARISHVDLSDVEGSCNVKASSIPKMAQRINEAKRALAKYDPAKVDYVRDCQEDIMEEINAQYFDEDYNFADEDRPVGTKLSEIKRDYLVGAIEDDLMTEAEFEDIYNLLDVVALEMSAPYC